MREIVLSMQSGEPVASSRQIADKDPSVGQCYMPKESLFDIWVEKLVALCIATGKEIQKFITDKAGECW